MFSMSTHSLCKFLCQSHFLGLTDPKFYKIVFRVRIYSMSANTLWQMAQNVLAPQNIDRLWTALNRDMLNIYVRKVSWQNLSVLRPRFNPLIHFYSKSNFPIFHQVLYRNLQIRPQKWVSHWFLTKKKKNCTPKSFKLPKLSSKKEIFQLLILFFKSENLARNNNYLVTKPNQTIL